MPHHIQHFIVYVLQRQLPIIQNTAIKNMKTLLFTFSFQTACRFCQFSNRVLIVNIPIQNHLFHLFIMTPQSLSNWKFLSPRLPYIILILLRILGKLFCRMSLSLVLPGIFRSPGLECHGRMPCFSGVLSGGTSVQLVHY